MQTNAATAPTNPVVPPAPGEILELESMPSDVLGQLLYTLERLGQQSLDQAETRVRATREELRESVKEFLESVRKMVEDLKKQNDDGGFFSKVVDSVASFAGKVVGTYTDAVLPVDSLTALVEGLASGENVLATLESAALELFQNGETADAVGGFSEGVVKFGVDASAYLAKLQAAFARAAVTGEDPYELVADDARALYASFCENIVENDDFWKVCEAAAKAATLAGTAASGGAGAIVAVALFAALELDARTGFIEKAVGEDAAPYVRAGVAVAGALVLGFGGGADGNLLRTVGGGLQGAVQLRSGYQAWVEANHQADALDDRADTLEALNRITELQQLLERLVDALDADQENHGRTRALGADLLHTRAATDRAMIIPA